MTGHTPWSEIKHKSGPKSERRVHPGTSKVFELIPIEQLKKLQQQFPLLRALRRKA